MLKDIYIIKWWETRGILIRPGRQTSDGYCWEVKIPQGSNTYVSLMPNQAFLTLSEAKAAIQKKAKKRIATLRKKADKLENEWLS